MRHFSFKEAVEQHKKIEYLYILIGTGFMAVATMWYFEPIGIVTGGVTGIGIILKNILEIPVWVVNLIANIPLFVIGRRYLSRLTMMKTIAGTASLTIILGIIPVANVLTGDKIVDIIYGSVFMGIGLGFVFRADASSGGTDLMAMLINKKLSYISLSKLLAIIDGVIVMLGISVFGLKNGVYSLICVFIISRVSDTVVEGPNKAKVMYIISDKNDQIVDYIQNTLNRGATYIEISGSFTGERRSMIMSVLSAKEMTKIKQILYFVDPFSICFVGDIREAFGEGFTKYKGQ